MNIATILGGPALVTYRGATFYSQSDIKLTPTRRTFEIAVDRFGIADERTSDEEITVSFTPAGEWENLSVLFPYASTILGSLISPQSLTVASIDTTDDELTVTAHGLTTADDVLIHVATGGTIATGLSNSTRYYVRAVDADTLTLHTSASGATNNTGKVDITAAGSGTHYVDRDYPLVIHTFAGIKLTLHNAALVKMPSINIAATKTALGEVTFEAFLRNGAEPDDANSRWTIAASALADTSFDPADIITGAGTVAWGETAPWTSFETKEGIMVDFALGLEEVRTDRLGLVTRRLARLGVTAKGQPMGITEQQLLEKMLIQDTGARRGRSLSGDDLVITSDVVGGPLITVYGAALKAAPQSFGAATERIGELEWAATRTFTDGAPDPLFAVSTVEA